MHTLWFQTFSNTSDWLVCSHCATLVSASVYNPDFWTQLGLLWLPLALLTILVLIVYHYL